VIVFKPAMCLYLPIMGWTLLKKASNPAEAMVLESILRSEGVVFRTEQETIGRMNALAISGLGEIKIFVEEEDFEKAKEVLDTTK